MRHENTLKNLFKFSLYNQLAYFRFQIVIINNNYIKSFISTAAMPAFTSSSIITRKG